MRFHRWSLLLLALPAVAGAQEHEILPIEPGAPAAEVKPSATTVPQWQAMLTVNGESWDLIEFGTWRGGVWSSTPGAFIQTSGFRVDFGAMLSPNPSILFGGAVTNFLAAPLTVGFTWTTPVALGPSTAADSRFSVTVTDGASDGASMGSVLGAPMMVGSASTGGPFATLNVDRGFMPGNGPVPCGFGAGGNTTTCNYGSTTSGFAATQFTGLQAAVNFTVSSNDIASFTGRVALNVVPEPATVALTGSGLALLAGVAARRRRRG